MKKSSISKTAQDVSDLDSFGEISLSDDAEISHSPLPSTNPQLHASPSPSELQDHHVTYLEAIINELENDNSKLLEQLSECQTKETVSKSTDTIDIRESGVHPGSIMSLSTGSEESAVDEERFVKVKANCEIDTSSSKASSQSGKENFELEEQIAGLAHEVDTLKAELKLKDEDYIRVKLELEALLLEKNVEEESITQSASQVTTLKDELISKDNALDDVRLILGEAIQSCQKYLSNDTEDEMPSGSLESMLFQINRISKLCCSSMEAAKEREEELASCIDGYQAISRDFEALQQQVQTMNENVPAASTDAELERFKQELLSKDEDLFEIQTRFDEIEQALEEKKKVISELETKIVSYESDATEQDLTVKLYKEKLSQANAKYETYKLKLSEATACISEKDDIIAGLKLLIEQMADESAISAPVPPQSSQHVPATVSESPVINLQQLCLTKVQSRMREYEQKEHIAVEEIINLQNKISRLESLVLSKDEDISRLSSEVRQVSEMEILSLQTEKDRLESILESKNHEVSQLKLNMEIDGAAQEEILSLQKQKSDFEALLLSKDDEICKLNTEMERLMSNIQVYQESIEQKALELTNCVNSKDSEMEQVISRYNQDSTTKDNHIAHLSQTIESQRSEIMRLLQIQNDAAASHESTLEYVKKMEQDRSEWFKEFELFKTGHQEQRALVSILQSEAQMKEQQISLLRREILDANEELSKMKAAYQKAEKDYKSSIAEIRLEFERKHAEEEVLRESELLSERKTFEEIMSQLKQTSTELGIRGKEISELTREKWELENDLQSKIHDITEIQRKLNKVEQELFAVSETNRALNSEMLDLRTILESTKTTLDMEIQARSAAESALTTHLQELEHRKVTIQEQTHTLKDLKPQETDVEITQQLETVKSQLENEVAERIMLERKVELLQTKISEIENSEIKSFEESFMLKGWVRQLELENLKYQDQLNSLLVNSPDSDALHPKLKTIQDEVIRLINALEERDKRCEQLTLEITRLLEERDGLQLKLSNVLKHNVALTERLNAGQELTTQNEAPTYDKEGLQTKLAQLEDTNYKMTIDLKREREARRLVQEQLLFSQTSRVYRDLNTRTRDASGQSSISLDSGCKTPSSTSQSPDHSCSDSGHPSVTSLDSGEHVNPIPLDPLPTSAVVHI